MNNEIDYGINNCITDLDTLIALDKRAMKDLENNTHKIKQHEVLTIIREFIRLRNDYNKEKEKNSKQFVEIENLKKEIFELNKEMSDFADQWLHKYKIREKIKKLENEFHFYAGRDPYEWDDSEFDGDVCDALCQQIKVLKELLEEEE